MVGFSPAGQRAIDRAIVKQAARDGYVVAGSLDSSAHLLWRDQCRARGWPYLAIFPREPGFEVELPAGTDLDTVRAIYQQHGVLPTTATIGNYYHTYRRPRSEPLARSLWAALIGARPRSRRPRGRGRNTVILSKYRGV